MNGKTLSEFSCEPTDKGFVIVKQSKPGAGQIVLHYSEIVRFVGVLRAAADKAEKLAASSSESNR